MEKKYREVSKSDIGQEVEGNDTQQASDGSWYTLILKNILEPDDDGRKFLGLHYGRWVAFRHARAELPPSYLELHQASGLQEGDWVKITRAAKDNEYGWDASWTDDMDQYVGSIAKISMDVGNQYGFKIDGAGRWSYPAHILEKVTSRPATEADEGLEVHWTAEPEKRYWLLSVFDPKNEDSATRAVLEPLHGGPFQFAFLDSIYVPLASEPQPPAEPAPAPDPQRPDWLPQELKEIPFWLPAGYRFMGPKELIKSGDKVQGNIERDPTLFSLADASIGSTVENSQNSHRYWITPISEGQANG